MSEQLKDQGWREGTLGFRTLHPSHLTPHEVLDHQPVSQFPRVKIWNHLHSQERESGTRVISSLQLLHVRSSPSQAATQGPATSPSSDPMGQSSGVPSVQRGHSKFAEGTAS